MQQTYLDLTGPAGITRILVPPLDIAPSQRLSAGVEIWGFHAGMRILHWNGYTRLTRDRMRQLERGEFCDGSIKK